MLVKRMTLDAMKTTEMARENHWGFRYIGNMEMLSAPFQVGNWEFIPLEDKSIIPKRAMQRIQAIEKEGIKTQGLVIAYDHEPPGIPKLLTAPPPKLLAEPKPVLVPKQAPQKTDDPKQSNELVAIAGTVLMTTFGVIGALLVGFISLLVFALSIGDPALIVVLEDGSWIEVMRWYE